MGANLDLKALKQEVEAGTIDTVLGCFADMQGRLIGKRVTGHFFVDQVAHEMHACDYLLAVDMEMEPVPGYAAASWDLGYGDFALRPDLATLRRIPWLDGTALVLGDVVDHHGELLAHAPRSILRRQIERAEALGYLANVATELEFYVFDEPYKSARQKGYKGLETAGWYIEDYHILQTTKEEGLIRAIRNGMDGAGIPVEFSKGEWGPGQAELNLRYAEALEMADRHVIYKNGVKEIALLQGKCVTFMAKWDYGLAGSSCHIHTSLIDLEGQPVFPQGDGYGEVFKSYLAGQLALARDITLFLAPYINSYKRFQAASFAPTKAIWSADNRTAGFRVVGHGPALRVECRIPGADANPYLAGAALLAAGLHGIENRLELGPAFAGDAYKGRDIPEVPKTLREALECLDRSIVLRAALGDAVVEHYLHAGRWEQFEYDRRVTDHELIRGFERA
jgi:glutamine synthetase